MNDLLQRHSQRRAVESMVPLINVIFLILIFFMVAGQLRQAEEFTVEPPQLTSLDDQTPEAITLLVNAEGVIAFQQQRFTLDTIAAALPTTTALITLKMDKQTPTGLLTQLLQQLEQTGFVAIHILALQEYE